MFSLEAMFDLRLQIYLLVLGIIRLRRVLKNKSSKLFLECHDSFFFDLDGSAV